MNVKNMKAQDSEIGKLIHEEGLLKTSPDFTQKLMQQIEELEPVQNKYYKPLISLKMWIGIAMSILIFITICAFLVLPDSNSSSYSNDIIDRILNVFMQIKVSFSISNGLATLLICSVVSIVLLLSLDFMFNRAKQPVNN